MKNKWIIVTGALLVLAAGLAYLRSDTGTEILQKLMTNDSTEVEIPLSEAESVNAEGTAQTELSDAGESERTAAEGFTKQQKEELEKIIAEVLEEKLTAALAENLNAMLEDGRLTAAVENYAAVQSSLVNVNTADETELTRLTGIGEARAKAIVAYRTEHGNFGSLEELTNVSGISSGILEKFRDQATL